MFLIPKPAGVLANNQEYVSAKGSPFAHAESLTL
jgi:hypothetical protein